MHDPGERTPPDPDYECPPEGRRVDRGTLATVAFPLAMLACTAVLVVRTLLR